MKWTGWSVCAKELRIYDAGGIPCIKWDFLKRALRLHHIVSMKVYIGFDDTDTRDSDFGTGKVARRFEKKLPEGCRLWGVIRQQLLVDERIPYTSHNSSACAVIDVPDSATKEALLSLGRRSYRGSGRRGKRSRSVHRR